MILTFEVDGEPYFGHVNMIHMYFVRKNFQGFQEQLDMVLDLSASFF